MGSSVRIQSCPEKLELLSEKILLLTNKLQGEIWLNETALEMTQGFLSVAHMNREMERSEYEDTLNGL